MDDQENNQNQEEEQPELPIVIIPETDEERKEHSFLTKARDRLHNRVLKYHGPRTDN